MKASSLGRIVKDYEIVRTLLDKDSHELLGAHRTDNPSQRYLIYAVRKSTIGTDKNREAQLFNFSNALKQNPFNITPPLLDLFSTETTYYLVFNDCMLGLDACLSQRFRQSFQYVSESRRAPLVRDLARIVNNTHIQLELQDFLVTENRIFILPSYTLTASTGCKEHNSKLCGQFLYMMLTGTTIASANKTEADHFTRMFVQNLSSAQQLNSKITEFIKKSAKEPEPQEDIDDYIMKLGVNNKIKDLAFQVGSNRASYNPGSPTHREYPEFQFLPQSQHSNPNNMRHTIQPAMMKKDVTKQIKLPVSSSIKAPQKPQPQLHGQPQQLPKNTNLMTPQYPNTPSPYPPQREKLEQLKTVYIPKEAASKDETNMILHTAQKSIFNLTKSNTSTFFQERSYFARSKSGFKSTGNTSNSNSGQQNNSTQDMILDSKSCKELFQEELKSYVTQFELFRRLSRSFLTYYGSVTNLGTVAAYLLTRTIAVQKLKLINALIDRQDIFQLGQSVISQIDLRPYIEHMMKNLEKEPTKIRALIHWKTVAPETQKILEPYMGDLDETDSTVNMCFSYLYTLSKRDPNAKDMHTMMLYDALYLLRHSGFQSVYDISMLPYQWDEEYVEEKKAFIRILTPVL